MRNCTANVSYVELVEFIQPEGCGYYRWTSDRLESWLEDFIIEMKDVRDTVSHKYEIMKKACDVYHQETIKQAQNIADLKCKVKIYERVMWGVTITAFVIGWILY